jgi:hypothetical protein
MKKEAEPDYRLLPLPEDLATQFLNETLAAIEGQPTMTEAYQSLWYGYFENLRLYLEPADFVRLGQLPRPNPLDLLVDQSALYRFFRGWLRQRGMEPDIILQAIPSLNCARP